jgi:Arc/MetJ-type ribon-helix-helix transcriptional regulator
MQNGHTTTKLTVSLPTDLARFLEYYQKAHKLESRSAVIAKSLQQLRDAELAAAYRAHAEEWQEDLDKDFWDSAAVGDGIDEKESKW